MNLESKILVTGCQGMGGWAVVRHLQKQGYTNILGIDRVDLDLLETDKVNRFFEKHKPEYVFHIAAKVGGIHANNTQGADFIYENLMMQCNVMNAAKVNNVKKLLFCGSACIYPKFAENPIQEQSLLTGQLEPTNKPYAVAKIAGVVMTQAYRKQYGCNFISVMPTNLYGINDNFSLENSHVMPALIRKFHDAKIHNLPTVEIWGTGQPRREFLNIEDFADGVIFLMKNYDGHDQVNIGTGKDIQIKILIDYIKEIVGYTGEIRFNTNYPDGVYQRNLDVSVMEEMGWVAKVNLYTGITEMYKWFIDNYNTARK